MTRTMKFGRESYLRMRLDRAGRSKKYFFLFVCFVLKSTVSVAGVTGIAGGVTYPTPLGFTYQTLDHSIGGQVQVWIDQSWISPSWQLHFAGIYEPFFARNQTNVTLNMAGLFGGLKIQNENPSSSFTPFFTIDIGAVYDWLAISGVANVTSNTALSFAAQAVPGIDLAVTRSLGLVLELPIRSIVSKNPWFIWDSTLSVRLKL